VKVAYDAYSDSETAYKCGDIDLKIEYEQALIKYDEHIEENKRDNSNVSNR
jgi:hypothetical protein